MNIAPTLEVKVDIVQNAIDLAQALSTEQVRVAILSAMETVNPRVPSTLEAAALCKMADRGQITGAILDGPLALDNAISMDAAAIKHIVSPVAGQANVLIVPDLEAGNMLAKSLRWPADAAGIVPGARVPIILTSRAVASDAACLPLPSASRSPRSPRQCCRCHCLGAHERRHPTRLAGHKALSSVSPTKSIAHGCAKRSATPRRAVRDLAERQAPHVEPRRALGRRSPGALTSPSPASPTGDQIRQRWGKLDILAYPIASAPRGPARRPARIAR